MKAWAKLAIAFDEATIHTRNTPKHNKETCGCPCRDPNMITTCMGICFYEGTCPPPRKKDISND